MEDEILDDDGLVTESTSAIYSWLSWVFGFVPLGFIIFFLSRTMGTISVKETLAFQPLNPIIGLLVLLMPIVGGGCCYLAFRQKEDMRVLRVVGIVLNVLSALLLYGAIGFAMYIDHNRGL